MRIGVTGWKGFIGSHLIKKIKDPILFDGDLRNIDCVKKFVSKCDRIYHVAGKNREEEGKILSNNLVSTGNLIYAFKQLEEEPEIVFISSSQVEWNKKSEYGFTKLIEESIIRNAKKWSVIRVPNVYGLGVKPFYNSVVATFIYQIIHKEQVIIKDFHVVREFIYIDDLIKYILNPKFYDFIFVRGEPMSIGEVYNYLTINLGKHRNLMLCLEYHKNHMEKDNESN